MMTVLAIVILILLIVMLGISLLARQVMKENCLDC